ncbi:MAG: ATP-binding protein [Candidatus Eisenbacteria bacterium]
MTLSLPPLEEHLVAGLFDTPILFMPYVCALGAVSIGALAFALRRTDLRLPWRWLGVFGLVHAGMFWLAMLNAGSRAPAAGVIAGVAGLAALGALLEFARVGIASLWERCPGRWIFLPVGGVWLWAAFGGGPLSGQDGEAILVFVAAGGSAGMLYLSARRVMDPLRRWLMLAGAMIFLHAFTGIVDQGIGRVGGAARGPEAGLVLVLLGLIPILTATGGLLGATSLIYYAFWREEVVPGSGLRRVRRRILAGSLFSTAFALFLGLALDGLSRHASGFAGVLLALAGPAILAVQFIVLDSLLKTWRALRERACRSRLENECLLSAVVDTAGDGLLVVDSEGHLVASNSAFLEITRISRETFHRMDEESLFASFREQLIAPEEFLTSVRTLRGSLGESLDLLRFKDGRVLRCSSRPLPEGGVMAGRVWVVSDITARTQGERERRERNARLERQSEALLQLAESQSDLYRDRPTALSKITGIAAKTLHVEHVSIWLYEAQGQRVRRCWHFQRSADRNLETLDEAGTEDAAHRQALRCESTLAVSDVRQDPRTRGLWDEFAVSRGIISMLDAPIRLQGGIVGLISLGHVGPPRGWTVDERIFAGCMADCVANVFEAEERQRVEQGLQRAQRFHRQVIETAATPFFMTDDEGRIREVNDAFCAATGFFPEEIIGRHYTVLARERCGADCPLANRDLGSRVNRHHCAIDDKVGRQLAIVLNASVVEDPDGRVQGRLFSFVDVTEAREARRETDTILRETETTRDQARTSSERRETLEHELEQSRTMIAAAQHAGEEAAEALRRERALFQQERKQLQEELRRQYETALEEKAELREQLRVQQEGAGKENARLEKELRQISARATEAGDRERAAANALEARARVLEEELGKARQQVEQMAGEARQTTGEIHDALEDTRRELAALRLEAEASQREAEQARLEAETSQREQELAQERLEQLRAQQEHECHEATRAQTDLERARAEIERLLQESAECGHDFETQAEEADRESSGLRTKLEAALTEAAELREQLETAFGEAAELHGRLEAAGGEIAELRAIRTAIEDQETGLERSRDELHEVQRLLEAARKEAAEKDRELEETRREYGDRQRELEAAREAEYKAKLDLAGLREAAERAERELAQAGDAEEALRRELERVRREAEQSARAQEERVSAARREAQEKITLIRREAAEKLAAVRHESREKLAALRREYEDGLSAAHADADARIAALQCQASDNDDGRATIGEKLEAMTAELQEAQEKFARLQDEARAAEASKGRLLANLSHGIRTPMNAIVGMTDLALAGKLAAEQRIHLEAVQASARVLLVLMDDLFDLARLEAGKLELEPAELDLRSVVTMTLQPFVARASQKKLAFTWSFASDIPPLLIGDPARLRQVLINIVGNAVKFTEQGRIELSVAAIPEPDDHVGLLFSVRDTGVGIAQDRLQALLNAARRIPQAAEVCDEEATGLGLTIAEELVRMMGGRIWAESKSGSGSTFHFTVRMKRAAAGVLNRESADESDAAESTQGPPPALDIDELLRRAGGNRESAREMAEVFLKESPRLLARIRQAILGRNAMALGVAAHLVKGAADNLAAEGARRSAERIEALARKNDLEGSRAQLKILETEIIRVRSELTNFSKAA